MILDRGWRGNSAQILQALLVATCLLTLMAAPLRADTPAKTDAPKSVTPKAQAKPAAKAAAHRHKPVPKTVAKAQPLPAQELPPMPAWLMNAPAVKPVVTLADGLLTIDAPNSTLSDVLIGVESVTGATFDGPKPTERIAIHLGPGHPGEVLTALLKGTPYDYIILGETDHPDIISRIVLNPAGRDAKESPEKEKAASAAPSEPPVRGRQVAAPAEGTPADDQPEEAAPEELPTHDTKPLAAQPTGGPQDDAARAVDLLNPDMRGRQQNPPQ